jgi:RimJ/RimL family protein N-acetyltransferase
MAEGFNELFIDVEERNGASIRGMEKAGYKRVVKVEIKRLLSKVRYKITVFNKKAWEQLSEIINNFPERGCVTEETINGSYNC